MYQYHNNFQDHNQYNNNYDSYYYTDYDRESYCDIDTCSYCNRDCLNSKYCKVISVIMIVIAIDISCNSSCISVFDQNFDSYYFDSGCNTNFDSDFCVSDWNVAFVKNIIIIVIVKAIVIMIVILLKMIAIMIAIVMNIIVIM